MLIFKSCLHLTSNWSVKLNSFFHQHLHHHSFFELTRKIIPVTITIYYILVVIKNKQNSYP